jgi:hypothetical protein
MMQKHHSLNLLIIEQRLTNNTGGKVHDTTFLHRNIWQESADINRCIHGIRYFLLQWVAQQAIRQ